MELNNNFDEGKPRYNLENLGKSINSPNDRDFMSVGKGKIDSLKSTILEIDFLIKQREALSEKISKDVEKIKMDIENFLLTNTAKDSDGVRERNGLRQKQIEVSELQLNERVNCWRDVAQLKKELRERQRELIEKEERLIMFDKILEERE